MYCSICGKDIDDRVSFCSSCGADMRGKRTHDTTRTEDGSAPLMDLRPAFVPQHAVLTALPLQAFFTLWGAILFGGFSILAIEALGFAVPKWQPIALSGVIFFVGIPLIAYFGKQKSYERTLYRFYSDKLDYFEGFFTTVEKSINYDKITEVSLRKGAVQKLFGLGTIVLSTPSSFNTGRRTAGIQIMDVPNPDRVFDELKTLINRL